MTTVNGKRFAAVILSYNRHDNVKTIHALRTDGYTGEIYVVVGNDDPSLDGYRERFGQEVNSGELDIGDQDIKLVVFDKSEWMAVVDSFVNNSYPKTVVYARNASQSIMRDLGYDYILQLDDDYSYFFHKLYYKDYAKELTCRRLDDVISAMIDFCEQVHPRTIAFCQTGDYPSDIKPCTHKRKAMNSFFIDLHNPVRFISQMNDDVNTYMRYGRLGELMLTCYGFGLKQATTQQQAGGLTDMYLALGTYHKSYHTVMEAPASVYVYPMGTIEPRLHHRTTWRTAMPCILSERHQKRRE